MKQDFKEQLTKVVMSLIQGDAKSAQEAFHQYLPAKSRDILLGEEDDAEEKKDDKEAKKDDDDEEEKKKKNDDDDDADKKKNDDDDDDDDDDKKSDEDEEVSKLEEVAKMKFAKKVVGPKSDKLAAVKVNKGKKA